LRPESIRRRGSESGLSDRLLGGVSVGAVVMPMVTPAPDRQRHGQQFPGDQGENRQAEDHVDRAEHKERAVHHVLSEAQLIWTGGSWPDSADSISA